MSCYLRPTVPGGTIFFTVCLAEAGSSLLVDEVARLRVAVRCTMAERPFRVRAWVVLPDHMHCVWDLPPGDGDYSTRWAAIKARFSRGLPEGRVRDSHVLRREKGIWQRRFWEHHCRGEEDVTAAVRFCWANPVRHGLAERPQDWPYSSVRRDMRSGTLDWQAQDVGCASAHLVGRHGEMSLVPQWCAEAHPTVAGSPRGPGTTTGTPD